MKTYKTHVFTYPLIDGKVSSEAEFVETVAVGKFPADRVKYWVTKAKNWNETELASQAADPKYQPLLVSENFSALTCIQDGASSFGKKFTFPTK